MLTTINMSDTFLQENPADSFGHFGESLIVEECHGSGQEKEEKN